MSSTPYHANRQRTAAASGDYEAAAQASLNISRACPDLQDSRDALLEAQVFATLHLARVTAARSRPRRWWHRGGEVSALKELDIKLQDLATG